MTSLLLKQAKIDLGYRRPIAAARERADRSGVPASAIELPDGTIITAETSALLGPSAALILNAVKHLAGIDGAFDKDMLKKFLVDYAHLDASKMPAQYVGTGLSSSQHQPAPNWSASFIDLSCPTKYIYWALERLYQAYKEFAVK